MTGPATIEDVGRPSKLTHDRAQRFFSAIAAGAPREAAARVAGISPATLFRWLRRADDPDAPSEFREFREELLGTEAELELALNETIRTAARSDWRAALAMAKARWPARYSERRIDADAETESGRQAGIGLEERRRQALEEAQRRAALLVPNRRQLTDGSLS